MQEHNGKTNSYDIRIIFSTHMCRNAMERQQRVILSHGQVSEWRIRFLLFVITWTCNAFDEKGNLTIFAILV